MKLKLNETFGSHVLCFTLRRITTQRRKCMYLLDSVGKTFKTLTLSQGMERLSRNGKFVPSLLWVCEEFVSLCWSSSLSGRNVLHSLVLTPGHTHIYRGMYTVYLTVCWPLRFSLVLTPCDLWLRPERERDEYATAVYKRPYFLKCCTLLNHLWVKACRVSTSPTGWLLEKSQTTIAVIPKLFKTMASSHTFLGRLFSASH